MNLDSSILRSTKNINDSIFPDNNQEDNLKMSQTRFDMKTNVKLKEVNKTQMDESGILNMTNSEWRDNQKAAPFKLNTKFTDALNDSNITNQIIGDLNKSTVVKIFLIFFFIFINLKICSYI